MFFKRSIGVRVARRLGLVARAQTRLGPAVARPSHDIRAAAGGSGTSFEITGPDPSVIIHADARSGPLRLSPGRYRFRVRLVPLAEPMWRPQLYIDLGSSFSEDPNQTFFLNRRSDDYWTTIFDAASDILALRLDPTSRDGGGVEIADLTIEAVDLTAADSQAFDNLQDSDVFCAAPFMQTVITATGEVHPCCTFNASGLSVNDRTPSQVWNGEEFASLRRQLTHEQPPAACSGCYQREKSGIRSTRNVVNYAWGTLGWGNLAGVSLPDLASRATEEDFKASAGPAWIELNLGNLCNLSCRMCYGGSSSSIASDPVHSFWSDRRSWPDVEWRAGKFDVLPRRVGGIAYSGFASLEWIESTPVVWLTGSGSVAIDRQGQDIASVRIETHSAGAPGDRLGVLLNGDSATSSLSDDGRAVTYALTDQQREADSILIGMTCEAPVAIKSVSLIKSKGRRHTLDIGRFSSGRKWFRDETFLKSEILELGPNVARLELKGGEPFLIKEVAPLFEDLIRRGVARNLDLVIVTNGTVGEGAIYDLLPQFKGISIIVSLDGTGALNDYIRHGSSWADVERNIRRFKQLKNTAVSVNTTAQAYNMLQLASIAEFVCQLDIGMSCNFLDGPDYLSCMAMPEAARVEAERRLTNFLSGSKYERTNALHAIRPTLSAIAAGLSSRQPTSSEKLLRRFVTFTRDLDADRGQDFRAIDGEMVAIIEAAGVPWVRRAQFHADSGLTAAIG